MALCARAASLRPQLQAASRLRCGAPRSFGARLRRQAEPATAVPATPPPPLATAQQGTAVRSDGLKNLALAVVSPGTPNRTSALQALNPFRMIEGGPELFSLVMVRTGEREKDGEFKGVEDAHLKEKIVQACAGQSRMKYKGWIAWPDFNHSSAQFGRENVAKLVPGAAVVVNLSLQRDALEHIFVTAGLKMTTGVANIGQAYGKVVNVHTGAGGEAVAADIAFEGVWSDDWVGAVEFHYHTEGGFYATAPAERILAHCRFRNIHVTTTLDYLQWEVALLWPELVALEDVVFRDASTGEALSTRAPKRIRDMLRGEVVLEVCGEPVPVLDPTLSVKPEALNLAITKFFGGAMASFIIGIWYQPLFWYLSPVGLLGMAAAAAVEYSWSSIALAAREQFATDLEALSDRAGVQKLKP